jgi:hypothetical protein
MSLSPKSKRWWMKELMQLRCEANKLGRQLYDRRSDLGHVIHGKHSVAVKNYCRILDQTKWQHWRDWLEKVEDLDIWTAHQLTSSAWGDGGKARIPALKYKVGEVETSASTNLDKGHVLAKSFFPVRPPADEVMLDYAYPPQCENVGEITQEQISAQL